jgi:hypothetical protein
MRSAFAMTLHDRSQGVAEDLPRVPATGEADKGRADKQG